MTYLKVIMCKEWMIEAKIQFRKPFISSLNFQILILFGFFDYSPDRLLKQFECISDLKVICAQSCGYIEALWALRSAKTCSQQHCS